MKPNHKRGRSESQRHHDSLLRQSPHDPLPCYKTSLEDMAETVKCYRETAIAAGEGEGYCKKALSLRDCFVLGFGVGRYDGCDLILDVRGERNVYLEFPTRSSGGLGPNVEWNTGGAGCGEMCSVCHPDRRGRPHLCDHCDEEISWSMDTLAMDVLPQKLGYPPRDPAGSNLKSIRARNARCQSPR